MYATEWEGSTAEGITREEFLKNLLDKNGKTYALVTPKRIKLTEYLTQLLLAKQVCLGGMACPERQSADPRIACERKDGCGRRRLATVAQILGKAGIGASYGNQIFNGKRDNPSRDKIIRLAFGFELTYEEAQELLRAARKAPLIGDDVERDGVFVRAFVKGYSLESIQATLLAKGLPELQGDQERPKR